MLSNTTVNPLARLQAVREQLEASPAARTPEAPAGAGVQLGLMARLRHTRDRLLETNWDQGGLANNPLQQLAAPALQAMGQAVEAVGASNILANIGKGLAIGSIILPDNSAVDPEDPMPALQTAAMFGGAMIEGGLADIALLRGLVAVRAAAGARGAVNVASSADKALRAFGVGEDLSKFRRIIGGGALGGTSELALQTAALQNPEDILKAAGIVTVAGGALGGAFATVGMAGRATVAGSRAARSFAEEFAESGRALPRQAEAAVAAITPSAEAGIARESGYNTRVVQANLDAEAANRLTANITSTQLGEYAVNKGISVGEAVNRLQEAGYIVPPGIFDAADAYAAHSLKLAEQGAIERGVRELVGPESGVIEFTADAIAARNAEWKAEFAAKAADPSRNSSPEVEFLFDRNTGATLSERMSQSWDAAKETFRNSFVYEAKVQHLPSTTGVKGLTMADDFRILRHLIDRSPALAEKDLKHVVAPLQALRGDDFTNAWKQFERIVVLRDLAETANKGLDTPLGVGIGELQQELQRLELIAPAPVLDAVLRHKELVNGWRDDLIRRGKLEIGDGYDNYFPHQIIEDLADEDAILVGKPRNASFPTTSALERGKLRTPRRPYTKQRGGSEKLIRTDYIDTMFRAGRRFHADNAVDDFLSNVESISIPKGALTSDQRKAINAGKTVLIDGQLRKAFRPRGPAYYRSQGVDDEAYDAILGAVADGNMDIDLEELVKPILAVGRPKTLILPAALADRLEQFYMPDPLRQTVAGGVNKLTAWWKRNTIWWGLSRFFMFQILGDSVNLMRSNPAAFAQIRNGRLNSPVFTALNETFKAHGAPLLSKEQMISSMIGGTAGMGVSEMLAGQDDTTTHSVASTLLGAGLGYALGTKRLAARGQSFSALYDAADKLAAINSGIGASEEAVARRVLGESSSRLPNQSRASWVRALDTTATLLSGKVHGDPYLMARVPFEILETVQTERENILRFASYIQQTQAGIAPQLAAKRARESLVDYGKFTDFENKVVRGFLLPFYAFTRHNTPNWVKAALGKNVGGPTKVGLIAAGGIASFDIAAQMWNEKYFPEIERELDSYRRERFHIIMGNPLTKEPYTDVNGKPMVIGWEMPYETALEMFGLARPGIVYSEMFGIGGQREDVSLVQRWQRTADEVAKLQRGPGKVALDLLSPFIKEPVSIAANKDFFYNAPIVPERYLGTPAARGIIVNHALETFVRQFREFQRTASQLSGKRFDPLTSAFGLGLPVERVDLNREIQGFLHEQMDEAQAVVKKQQAEWKKPIDDILYSRQQFSKPEVGELDKVLVALAEAGADALQREQALRYYMTRGGQGSMERRWNALNTQEKVEFFNSLPPWAKTFFVGQLNFGDDFGANVAGGLGILGN